MALSVVETCSSDKRLNLYMSKVNFVRIMNEQSNSIKTHGIKAVTILHTGRIALLTASTSTELTVL